MSDRGGVDIPDLKKLDPRRKDEKLGAALRTLAQAAAPLLSVARQAAPRALAAALVAGGALAGARGFSAWRASRLRLDGVRSTIRPEPRADSLRLELAAQASRGELRWGAPAPAANASGAGSAFGGKTDWAAVLRGAVGRSGPATTLRVKTNCALAQAVAARDFSRAGAAQATAERASDVARTAFTAQLVLHPGAGEVLLDSVADKKPGFLTSAPAPDVVKEGRNATPYQDMLDRAYADAHEAAGLRKKAPKSLALGAALTAAGKAILGVPGASLAAHGLLAAGAAATSRGVKQTKKAARLVAEAHRLASGIRLLQGQKDQADLADICLDSVARGEKLERCQARSPAMTALAKASLDRQRADSASFEVEGGRAL